MNKSKIEWCDYTWNPVTGCMHGCEYCYARRIAERFRCKDDESQKAYEIVEHNKMNLVSKSKKPFPLGFTPTFYPHRLTEPQQVKKPSKIFVVSMGDLFGEWVPDEWINEVMKSLTKAPQHTYMLLTKNPSRYGDYFEGAFQAIPEEYVFDGIEILCGTTITSQKDADVLEWVLPYVDFVSIEPLLEDIDIEHVLSTEYYYGRHVMKWVIVGAQTGPGAVPPKPEWVQDIIDQCRAEGVPIFLKDNLNWPEKIQEWPE